MGISLVWFASNDVVSTLPKHSKIFILMNGLDRRFLKMSFEAYHVFPSNSYRWREIYRGESLR